MESTQLKATAGKTIGLCFSGGGHRASIFSLGALLYLVDAGHHRDVRVISSVSGGSLTSVFLAIQQKPVTEMDRQEFDNCAANWARQIAGSPTWWWTALGVHVLLVAAWILFLSLGWTGSPRLARWPWWATQIVYLAAVWVWARIVGPRPGGTFWGWWGTWLYLGVLLPALFLFFAVWWSPLPLGWRLAVVVLAACALWLRPYIADLAFRATVCGDKQLRNLPITPRNVFCASEMHTGRDAFFCRDLIYSLGAGLGRPADLLLSTALQVSANFPVLFPYRILRLKKCEFKLGLSERMQLQLLPALVLADGGLQDNTGVTWFLGASERNAILKRFFEWCSSLDANSELGAWSLPDEVRTRIAEQLAAMEYQPDLLIVVNSSFAHEWSNALFRTIPILGELAALLRVQGVIYDRRGREQSHQLSRSFFRRSLVGAMVSIIQHPNWVDALLLDPHPDEGYSNEAQRQELGLSDLPKQLLESYRQRARAARDREVCGPDYETESAALAQRSRDLADCIKGLENQKAQASPDSSEDVRIDLEIARCRNAQSELDQTFQNKEVQAIPKNLDESLRRREETLMSCEVPTTFRPLGVEATSKLLRHGYLNCMNICHLLLEGFPRFDNPPTDEEMTQLARGVPRRRHPSSAACSY